MERYSKIGRIGEGSFGKVYKATDRTTNCVVALKVIQTVNFFVVYIYFYIIFNEPNSREEDHLKKLEDFGVNMKSNES